MFFYYYWYDPQPGRFHPLSKGVVLAPDIKTQGEKASRSTKDTKAGRTTAVQKSHCLPRRSRLSDMDSATMSTPTEFKNPPHLPTELWLQIWKEVPRS